MSGSLIDANVLLDIATADPTWAGWSQEQVRAAAERGAVYINPIIYAEIKGDTAPFNGSGISVRCGDGAAGT